MRSKVALLSKYDLTDKKGCLLSKISVFKFQESDESDNEETEPSHNVVHIESHVPGIINVIDSITGRHINIQVEEYKPEEEIKKKKKSNKVSPE